MPKMVWTAPLVLSLAMTGEATATWGSFARTIGAIFAGTAASLRPLKLLELGGRTMMSAPIPLVCVAAPCTWPIITATMDRIMITSMATARTLMAERTGRYRMLPRTSLFIGQLDEARNPSRWKDQGNKPAYNERGMAGSAFPGLAWFTSGKVTFVLGTWG